MATSGGPNLVNNGLILSYDAANIKSFRGEPTTNLAANGGLIGMSGITLTYITEEDGWKKYSMSGTFTGGSYPYIMHVSSVTFTGGVTYTSKCTIKTNVMSKFNYFGVTGINYVNEPMNSGGSAASISNSDGSFTVSRTAFAYTNTTTQPGYLLTNPINNTTFNSSTDFVWIKELQIEQKSYSTFYVNGTRGTTVETGGGLIDLSKNNSNGELLGPIYNSSNQGILSFDGTDDIISIPNSSPINISGNITINCWVRRNTSAGGVIIHKELQYTLLLNANGTLTYADSSLWSYASFGDHGNIAANQFVNIAVTKSGSTVTIYANGSVVISKTFGGAISQTSNTLYIGAYNGGSAFFNGLISNVQIYNRSLTADEILQNFNSTRGRFRI